MTVSPLYVTSVGMVCPLGLRAETAYAAMRAGVKCFQESRYRDDNGEPIICSELSLLPVDSTHRERLLVLLGLAVADAARGVDQTELAHMPLLVGTSEPERPGCISDLHAEVIVRLQREKGLLLNASLSHGISTGNTAGLRALAEARSLLERQPWVPGCFVAGVDSLVNAPAIWWLDENERLKRSDFPDGVIPGEAAACVLVTRKPRLRGSRLMAVLGLGFARETALPQSEEPLRAHGLVQASRAALVEAGLSISGIDFRLSDAAGESHSFKEVSLALSRMLRVNKESMPLWLPAESLGETGAASGLTALVMASMAMDRGHAPGTRAIAYTAAASGDRAVAVVGI
ncbi:hypothetical protein [Cystobacter fuscus]|uniref:hypothetical protein n=1 Tax=Cystobacter fuscus TaxID=43 RepID=UPI002B29D3FF|nr:3-oxoacyl-ACP synthase [Cystobacter fuscus]